jgi:polyketide biosynthesis acyl carrier protein
MTEEDVLRVIIGNICDVLPDLKGRELVPQDSLRDLGANSTDRSEIVMLTLEALSLQISLVETFGPANIGELSQLLHEKLERR